MNKRIFYIDALRFFAIFCIILIHSTAYMNSIYGPSFYVATLGNFGRFSVSLFIFLSGFCLSLSYLARPIDNVNFFIHHFRKIVPAYLIWNFIYQIHYRGSINIGTSGLKALFYGNAASHLYFIPVILGLYLTFPFIWKHKNKMQLFLIIAFVIQISAQIARYYAFSIGMPIAKDARAFFPLFLGYFVLGIFCAINLSKVEAIIHKYQLAFIIATILSFGMNTIFPNNITYQLYYLLSIPTVFIVFHNVSNPFFSNLSKAGYYIFLMHHIILDYLVQIPQLKYVPPFFSSIILALLTYVLSYAISLFYLTLKAKAMRKPFIYFSSEHFRD
jgi:peptidoglycan/LPS O-acetylase OafA/YrhL